MINYNDNTIYLRVFHQANKFKSLVESYNIKKADFFDLNVIYVNMLLSCELYLKSILSKYGVSNSKLQKCGHNLESLFNLLNNDIQKELINRFKCFYVINLCEFLNKVKNDFVECRYMFLEEKNNKMYFNFVKNLMYELNHMASVDMYGMDTYKELK